MSENVPLFVDGLHMLLRVNHEASSVPRARVAPAARGRRLVLRDAEHEYEGRARRVLGLDPPAEPQNASSLRTTVAPVLVRRPCRGDHAARGVARECYLVDPASSHMLVSKIKPCMCKYELIQTVKLRMAH